MPSTPISIQGYRGLLTTYLKPQWFRVLILVVLLLCNISLQLVNPQIVQMFIDSATTHATLQFLLYLALAFLAVAFLSQAVATVETYVAENVSLTATNALRADLTLHCLQLDPSFHTSHTPGELIERVDGDVGKLGNFFSRFVVALLGNALLLVGVLILLFRIDWRVGTSLTLFVIVALVIVGSLRNIGVPFLAQAMQSEADLFGFLEERISGTEDIRSSGANTDALRGLQQHSRSVLHTTRRASLISLTSFTTTILLFAIGTAIALALGVYLFKAGTISIGTVYLIFGYTTLLNRPVDQIVRQIEDLQKASASIQRIRTLFEIQSTIQDGEGVTLLPGPLAVKMQNVSFSYMLDVPVLKHISFSLQSGEVLGLLGRTGSGKTTLTKLLVRLYDPTSGTIQLNNIDLTSMHLADVRRHVGVVTQDIQLFHGSVRNNLTFFDATIADKRILEVLEELGLIAWYKALPQGLDTKLASGGSGLSAGEAQLLAFARVFLKDPGLVILDEASSRLDPATEHHLEQVIDRLLEGRTCIIIAHRLTTIRRADTILILQNGECCEYGPREVLASDTQSRFSHLLRTGLEEVLQ